MFKTILVPYLNSASEQAPLTAGLALAEQFAAHLTVLVTVDVPPAMPDEFGVLTNDFFLHALDEARARAEALAQQLKARCSQAIHPAEVRLVEAFALYPTRTAALNARYADLVIAPSAPAGGGVNSKLAHAGFRELLMSSGRPVLVVPANASWLPASRVVIAWQPTREASRAVHDALPLLKLAEAVDVLMIDPQVGEAEHGAEPGADIAAHLVRHGIKVEVFARPSLGQTVASAILAHARRVDAGLIVAGGYGHSRLREFVLGGVTRELLESSSVPMWFAH